MCNRPGSMTTCQYLAISMLPPMAICAWPSAGVRSAARSPNAVTPAAQRPATLVWRPLARGSVGRVAGVHGPAKRPVARRPLADACRAQTPAHEQDLRGQRDEIEHQRDDAEQRCRQKETEDEVSSLMVRWAEMQQRHSTGSGGLNTKRDRISACKSASPKRISIGRL